MDAVEFLRQIRKIDALIESKEAEKRRWDDVASGMGAFSEGERVQSTRDLHRMSNAVAESMDLQSEIDCLRNKRREIMAVVEKLPVDEYKLVYKIYVEGLLLKVAAVECKKSYDWARKKHASAKKLVNLIINPE
jgi:hypothetical protein